RVLSEAERDSLLAVGVDLIAVWHAPTTSARDRKELLRTLLEEVIIKVERDKYAAHLTMRWKGGALTELDLHLPHSNPANRSHRRGYHCARAPLGRALSRCDDRWHSQSPGSQDRLRSSFQDPPRRQLADPMENPTP